MQVNVTFWLLKIHNISNIINVSCFPYKKWLKLHIYNDFVQNFSSQNFGVVAMSLLRGNQWSIIGCKITTYIYYSFPKVNQQKARTQLDSHKYCLILWLRLIPLYIQEYCILNHRVWRVRFYTNFRLTLIFYSKQVRKEKWNMSTKPLK